MASALRAAASIFTPVYCASSTESSPILPSKLHFKRSHNPEPLRFFRVSPSSRSWRRFTVLPFATSEETTEAEETTEEESETEVPIENDPEPETESTIPTTEENPNSALISILEAYKEALATNDKTKISEIETLLLSIEQERASLSTKIASLEQEVATERARILRISADFENFRKRTEKEKFNLMDNAKGEVIEGLLPVIDNFERAKTQIKVETEGEVKINTSYQSIYKQFVEILTNLGVKDVETIGTSFDPMFHEAIMQEESTEFEEGIIVQEFRKGFQLGDRLLRPAMVKVSAGPGPAKSDDSTPEVTEDGVLPQDNVGSSD